MSVNLYGILETYDRKNGKWERFCLYEKNDDGEYVEVDLMTGGRSVVDAVFGRDDFDYVNDEDDETDYSPKARLLAMVDTIIQSAACFDIENNFSPEAMKKLSTYYSSVDRPRTITYTYQDVLTIRLLSGQISARAEGFYENYFSHIESVLRVVYSIEYLCSPNDVRITLFAL